MITKLQLILGLQMMWTSEHPSQLSRNWQCHSIVQNLLFLVQPVYKEGVFSLNFSLYEIDLAFEVIFCLQKVEIVKKLDSILLRI